MREPSTKMLQPPPSPSHIERAASWLWKRGLSYPLRRLRKQSLRAAYRRGGVNAARDLPAEDADPTIIEAGRSLRQQLLAASADKHRSAAYRVLMFQPGSITAEIWFGDLHACMQHAGIECRLLPPRSSSAEINACFEEFQPNVFIATEATVQLSALDLPFIRDYKNRHGCLRLFIPVWHSGMHDAVSSPRHDQWRWGLRRGGLTADAHFSIFEREFHDRFARDKAGPDIDFVTIPQACNPFTDQPLAESKRYDYFMATSLSDDRLEVTCRFLPPIFSRYRGLWAGPGWGFGREYVPPAEMPRLYAQTRIALSPLAGFVPMYAAELTHRIYACAGCGTFQLTMPTAITNRYFENDELVQAGTPREYVRLFDHYVDRPDERNAIALRALRRAYGEHTCFHRIDKLVEHWDDWRRRGLF